MSHSNTGTAGSYMPFAGVKVPVTGAQSYNEVLRSIDADWQTEFQPVHTAEGVLLEKYKAPVRSDTRQPLGAVVGADYGAVHNKDLGELCQFFVDEGLATYKVASSYLGGCRQLIEMELREGSFALTRHNGAVDAYEARISVLNGHDGSQSWVGAVLTHRLVCQNQLPAIKEDGRYFSFRHSSRVQDRRQRAKFIFTKAVAALGEDKEALSLLARHEVDAQGFTEFCARLLTGKNDRDAALKAVDETQGRSRSMLEHKFEVLATLFMKGAGNTGHDALDVLNAVTEWVDHARGSREDEDELLTRAIARRTAVQRDIEDAVIVVDSVPEVLATADRRRVERRMQSSMLGSGRDLKNRARDLLMATVRDANPTGARRLTA